MIDLGIALVVSTVVYYFHNKNMNRQQAILDEISKKIKE